MNLTNVLNLDSIERFDSEFSGEPFWFEAKSHKLTPNFHQAIIDAVKQPVQLAEQLSEIITAWNIFLVEDGDFPPSAENLAKTPEEFVFHLVDVIAASWQGKKTKVSKSQNGSVVSAK